MLVAAAVLLLTIGGGVAAAGTVYEGGGVSFTVDDASGPIGGTTVTIQSSGNGTLTVGDVLTILGDLGFNPGACITFIDGDGTIGTFCDGQNADFELGSLVVNVTGAASGVQGGDGVLANSGLVVYATDGVTVSGGGDEGSALPQTGGEFAWLIGGLLVLVGSGLALRRATRVRTSES